MQAKSSGYIKDLNHLRKIVFNSFPIEQYSPQVAKREEWKIMYQKYLHVVK